MLKKIFVLLCLATFVSSIAACGGSSSQGFKENKDAAKNKPLNDENAQQNAGTEAY